MRKNQAGLAHRLGRANVSRSHCSSRLRVVGAAIFVAVVALPLQAAPDLHMTQAGGAPAASADMREYAIAAGPLPKALNSFAEISGLELVYPAALANGLSTGGLAGRYSPREALAKLLEGTGLTYRFTKERSVTLEKAPEAKGAMMLNTLSVEGAQASAAAGVNGSTDVTATEGTGSYTTRAVGIGGKSARSPKDIQQSVTVVTQQRIEDQKITDVAGALSQATGITEVFTGVTTNIYSRGFAINSMQIDGGSPAYINNYGYNSLPDLAQFDHVEVLRGSDGVFAGAGQAGGTINLVRKRPLDHDQVVFDASGGSWNNYRSQIDVTGPVGYDGQLRGRIVAAYEDRDYFYDTASENKTVLYGIAEADLTTTTLLTLGGSVERRNTVPFYTGLPRYSSGNDLGLPRNTCLCAAWSRFDFDTPELFARLEQNLGRDWTFKVNLSQSRQTTDAKYASSTGAVNPYTLSGPALYGYAYNFPNRQTLADVTLNGSFDVLGRRQEITLGGNWQDVDAREYTGASLYPAGGPAVNVFDFNTGAPSYAEPATPAYPTFTLSNYGQEQKGIYATLHSQIIGALHSLLGARFGDYQSKYIYTSYARTGVPQSITNQNYSTSSIITPYGGLTYDLSKAISLYGSYARIFQPQGTSVTESGAPLKPVTGDSYEIGAKASWLDGALNASLAGYKIMRKNGAVLQSGVTGSFGDLYCCYVAAAELDSKGIDAELTGQLLPGWQLFAGYTYNVNEYEEGYGANDGTAFMPQTPKHLLKLWSVVQLPGAGSAWRLGGGINAQTANYVSGSVATYGSTGIPMGSVPYKYTQGGYAVASLSGEYRINLHWSAALNVNNILDRTYYQAVGSSASANFYGDPRNFMLSIRGSF